MNKMFYIICILFFILLLDGCYYESQMERDYKELVKTLDKLPDRRETHGKYFHNGTIKIDMTRDEILSLLGNPHKYRKEVTKDNDSELFIYYIGDGLQANCTIENGILKKYTITEYQSDTSIYDKMPMPNNYYLDRTQRQLQYQQTPQYKERTKICPACGGTGSGILPCPNCNGTGKVGILKCPVCNGTGFPKCLKCNGTGRINVW